jgi:hypothetical protein
VAAFNLAAAKPQMPMSDVVQRVTTRWENHMASDKAQLSDKLGGQTPVAAGQMLYNRGKGGRPPGGQLRRDGLRCNVLSQGQVRLSETEIWLITARDANRRSAYFKTFGGGHDPAASSRIFLRGMGAWRPHALFALASSSNITGTPMAMVCTPRTLTRASTSTISDGVAPWRSAFSM